MDFSEWEWIREPEKYQISERRIEVTTEAHTDLWQRTYYHFRNDNAPVFQMETEEKTITALNAPLMGKTTVR